MSRELDYEYRTFDATSLTGSFQDLGLPTSAPIRKLALWNTSDVDAIITTNGSDNNIYLPAGGAIFFDEWRSNQPNDTSGSYPLRKGRQLRVKQVSGAGSSGDIVAQFAS